MADDPLRQRALELLSDASYRLTTPTEKIHQNLVAMNGIRILDELERSGASDRGRALDVALAVLAEIDGEDASYTQPGSPSRDRRIETPGQRVELFYVPKRLLEPPPEDPGEMPS